MRRFRGSLDFATEEACKEAHRAEHLNINSVLNRATYALPGESIQDAIDLAVNWQLNRVCLVPGASYPITDTITLPENITLDGGGGIYGSGGAVLQSSGSVDVMIALSERNASLYGLQIRGQNAQIGVFATGISNAIERCAFTNFAADKTAIRYGGALYQKLTDTYIGVTNGRAIDALQAYKLSDHHYYGVNVLESRNNALFGKQGTIRMEGIMTSICDKIEGQTDGVVVEVGGTVQSKLTMIDPYLELTKGAVPMVAFRVNNACRLMITSGEMFGQESTKAGSVAIQCVASGLLSIHGFEINRFETGFAGSCLYPPMDVSGVRMTNVDTASALTYPASDANVFNYVSA